MKIAGVVAEYNPYHNGHRYLAENLRKQGATHIAAVMSGHLVQRGEVPLFSKWARAKAALKNGIDLIIELPSLYAALSAERFADAAVSLLDQTGCIDLLGFGSETGNTALILEAARLCTSACVNAEIRTELGKGVSYAAARQAAVEHLAGEGVASVLTHPNNILAVEYCKALRRLNSQIKPIAVTRMGAEHDSSGGIQGIASASFLRDNFRRGLTISEYVPESAMKIYTEEFECGRAFLNPEKLEIALLFQLRKLSAPDFAALPDVSEGLELRLWRAAQSARSLAEFYALAKTKRYAHSRLRRIVLYAALGITKADLQIRPPYLHILGANSRGLEIMAEMKKMARLPYGTSLAKLSKSENKRIAELEIRSGNLFALGVEKILPGGLDYTAEAVMLK